MGYLKKERTWSWELREQYIWEELWREVENEYNQNLLWNSQRIDKILKMLLVHVWVHVCVMCECECMHAIAYDEVMDNF